jgi:hypothetical protein
MEDPMYPYLGARARSLSVCLQAAHAGRLRIRLRKSMHLTLRMTEPDISSVGLELESWPPRHRVGALLARPLRKRFLPPRCRASSGFALSQTWPVAMASLCAGRGPFG